MAVDPSAFFASLMPAALKASQATGVDPRIILSQAALESGYGRHAPGNNLFGIKSHGQGGGNSLMTTEVIGGVPVRVKDSFRGYSSPEDSVQGYADFITSNPRYKALRSAQGLDAQLAALGKSGYATDPNYASKIGAIARGIDVPGMAAALPPPRQIADAPVASMGSPSPQGQTQPQSAPQSILSALTGKGDGTGNTASNYLAMLGSMSPEPQQMPAPPPVQGPSPEQANALSSLVQALMQKRMV